MKYLKPFNESINRSEIDAICKEYEITNYSINEDGSIDVVGNVNLHCKKLYTLPLTFGKVTGYFECEFNRLTNLEGSPRYVGSYFSCNNNKLTSLIGAPNIVKGSFSAYHNQLTSLQYCPKYVGRHIIINNNKLKNIDSLSETYESLKIYNNPINDILKLFVEFENVDYRVIIDTKENKDLLYIFNDREIIQNDILILDRLVEFLEDIGKPKSKEYLYEWLSEIYTIV